MPPKVEMSFINNLAESFARGQHSMSRQKVLLIDCCYSGAFDRGYARKADKEIHTSDYLNGGGTFVITASDAMQYSFEGDRLNEENSMPSVFTHSLIDGLNSGQADHDKNGLVTPEELYEYVYEHVTEKTAYSQTPQRWAYDVKGDIVIAKNPYTTQEKEIDPNELILDATEDLKKGDYNGAKEKSSRVIEINPKSTQQLAQAYNIKGSSLFGLKQYDEAMLSYEKALELRPKYIEAINNKGLVLAAIGNYSKALECFNQSTNLNSKDASIWNYKGLAFHALEKYEEAIRSFDNAISLNPSYTEALNNRISSSNQLNKKNQQQQQEPHENTTDSSRIKDFFQSSSSTIPSKITSNETFSHSSEPIAPHSRTGAPSFSSTSKTIEQNMSSDIPKSKEAIPSIKTSNSTSDQNRSYSIHEIKRPPRNNLKILIPVVAAVIGIVIAVVILGSGIMHPEAQRSPSRNTPPTAIDQSTTTNQNKPVNITLAGSDPNQNDRLTAVIVKNPAYGTLSSINQDIGGVTYTPNSRFTGIDTFRFKVNDGKVDSNNTGIVTITVNSNNPPTANNQSVITTIDKPVNIELTAKDLDKNDKLVAAIVSKPSHGSIGEINQATGIVTYTPNPGFTGTDSFTFKVNDGKVDSNIGTIIITVKRTQ